MISNDIARQFLKELHYLQDRYEVEYNLKSNVIVKKLTLITEEVVYHNEAAIDPLSKIQTRRVIEDRKQEFMQTTDDDEEDAVSTYKPKGEEITFFENEGEDATGDLALEQELEKLTQETQEFKKKQGSEASLRGEKPQIKESEGSKLKRLLKMK